MAIDLTFDLSTFLATARTAYAKLGELDTIDRALHFLRSGGTGDELPERPDSSPRFFTLTLGTTYPFDPYEGTGTYLAPDAWVDDVNALFASWAAEGASWAEKNLRMLLDQCADVLHTWPIEFQTLNEGLVDIHNSLAVGGNDDFGGLAENLGVWKGEARDAFVNDWYVPFREIRSNQCFVMKQVASSLSLSEAMTSTTQHALMNAVEAFHQAVDEQLRKRKEDNAGASASEALGMISMFSGFLGAVTFWAPPVSATFSIVSATSGLASAGVPEATQRTVKVEGALAHDLETSLDEIVADHMRNWNESLTHLGDSHLLELEAFIDTKHNDLRMFPRAPGLDTNPDPDDFHHETSKQY